MQISLSSWDGTAYARLGRHLRPHPVGANGSTVIMPLFVTGAPWDGSVYVARASGWQRT
jgi:hypothetical protein